ncbi:hypothetical protein IMSHALPRED_001337 [Imshaugia aleurites]|uniref:Uncharacterized protein n=1 Tax=Imshaugia aleurites TaxID=172621 RepID=A0A8H3J2A5_9LECA|nr:hypothetical protein IMSHALPRED_001337 [Imshaugia aleurites]
MAMISLIGEPGFRDPWRFSRNPRRGVQVPKGWRSGNCLIMISCENDYDADDFSYADVLRKAKNVVDQCVDVAEGEIPWGGVDKIGTVGSFYVSVNGRLGPDDGTDPLVLTNVTSEA